AGGSLLASGGEDGVFLWDIHTFRPARRCGGPGVGAEAIALGAGGRTLAAARWGRCWLWESATGKELCRFRTSEDYVSSVLVFAADGTALAADDDHGRLQLWDPATGRQLRPLDCPLAGYLYPLALSSGPRPLAVGMGVKGTWLWDTAGTKLVHRLG